MSWLKYAGLTIVAIIVLVIGFNVGSWWTGRKIGDLQAQLAKSAETIELTTDLYAKQTVQLEELTGLLEIQDFKMKVLRDVLNQTKAEVLTLEKISLRWKKAYEDLLDAHQTEEPPAKPGDPSRKRVDFSGKLGPIRATGHTLTDPPEAFLKLEQMEPLTLTLAVAQNEDGSWSTFVTPSDSNVDVKIDLAAVNPKIFDPKWYQKIWVEIGASVLGDPSGTASISYFGDRWSFGAYCYTAVGGSGCGGTLGARLFK